VAVGCLSRHQQPARIVLTGMMFRIWSDPSDLNVLLGQELPGGQLRIPLLAILRFNAQMDRQLRTLERTMKRKYPTRSRSPRHHPRTWRN